MIPAPFLRPWRGAVSETSRPVRWRGFADAEPSLPFADRSRNGRAAISRAPRDGRPRRQPPIVDFVVAVDERFADRDRIGDGGASPSFRIRTTKVAAGRRQGTCGEPACAAPAERTTMFSERTFGGCTSVAAISSAGPARRSRPSSMPRAVPSSSAASPWRSGWRPRATRPIGCLSRRFGRCGAFRAGASARRATSGAATRTESAGSGSATVLSAGPGEDGIVPFLRMGAARRSAGDADDPPTGSALAEIGAACLPEAEVSIVAP